MNCSSPVYLLISFLVSSELDTICLGQPTKVEAKAAVSEGNQFAARDSFDVTGRLPLRAEQLITFEISPSHN